MTIEREGLERDIQTLWEIATRYADMLAGGREFCGAAQAAKELTRYCEALDRFAPARVVSTNTIERFKGTIRDE